MKILIQENSVKQEDLRNKLVEHFPNYKFKNFNKSAFIVARSETIGANIFLKKNRILIAGNFPTFGGRFLFLLSLILLGVLIPLIIYLIVFQSKFSKFEKEIGIVIQKEFGITK